MINSKGIVLLCNIDGGVIKVISNDFNIMIQPQITSLVDIIDRPNLEKLNGFLKEIKTEGVVLNWEMNVVISSDITLLNFAGIYWEQELIIIAVSMSSDISAYLEELSKINNNYTSSIRGIMKNLVREEKSKDKNTILYEEISRLNNELTNMQRELVKKNMELEKLNEQKSRFLGMAAHDLRNPLGWIQAYSSFLMEDVAQIIGEEQLEFIRIIKSSSEYMLNLINDVLDFSKISSGKLNLELDEVNIGEVIKSNVYLNNMLAKKKDISLVLDCKEDLPLLKLDLIKIQQVLNNLISNAIKFSYSGGEVRIEVFEESDFLNICIIDSGAGISPQEVDIIFKAFEKTSSRPTNNEHSTGLGLWIVKNIVEGHKGKIKVDSEKGKGTTFTVYLPIASA